MKYALLLFLTSLFPTIIFSQWNQLGPGGGDIEVMERIDGDIWVGTRYGIYISEDEGETWRFDERFGRGRYILLERVNDAIYIHGSYTAAGQSQELQGFFRSVDEGRSWTLISATLEIGLTFLPDMVDILECGDYAYFRSSGNMFVSIIGEWDWEPDTIASLQQFSTVRQDQSTIVISGATQISVSTDCGETWVDKPSAEVATYAQYVKGDTLIGPQRSFGQWSISYDLGTTWERQPDLSIYFQDKIIQLPDGSYVEFGLGFFHAPQVSGPWTGISASEDYGFIEDALLLSNGEILICGEEGLFRVNVDRDEMSIDVFGPPIHTLKRVLASDNGMYVASSELITYQSQDGGRDWGLMILPRNPQNFNHTQDIKGYGWIDKTFFSLANGIVTKHERPYRQYDQISPSPAGGPYYDLEVADGLIYVASDDGYWRGTIASDDFEAYPQGYLPQREVKMYQAGDYIYLNLNSDWSRYLKEGASEIEPLNWIDTEYRFVKDRVFRCQPDQWSISEDDGVTWTDCAMSSFGVPADEFNEWLAPVNLVEMNDSLFLTPSFKEGIYVSADGGFSWESRTFNLEGERILSIASDNQRTGIVASVAGKSLFGYFPEGFSNSNELVSLAMELQAYPNPASSSVQLSFTKELPRNAQIGLFSSSGQQLSPYILNRDNKKALLVVEHLPEGLYYVLVQVGKEVVTTPVVVAR